MRLTHVRSYACARELDRLCEDWMRLAGDGSNEPAHGKTVLVVDDDVEVNACLGVRLQAAGYEVLSAFDGDEGLSTALTRHPDAVVLDVRMPNKDGLTMLREMRTHREARNTPVVVLSASVRDQHRALEAGANYFVTKPYDAKDVLTAIQSSLLEGAIQ
jgi:DNA-binding response OmpR family regulator